jgi:glucose/arabinose dehydrogenase
MVLRKDDRCRGARGAAYSVSCSLPWVRSLHLWTVCGWASAVLFGCTSKGSPPTETPIAIDSSVAPLDSTVTSPTSQTFCSLPGSLVFTSNGPVSVGQASSTDLSWLTLPQGFCVHAYATVPACRQLRFSPDNVLFAASPSRLTIGGAGNGMGVVARLPENSNGEADTVSPFLQVASSAGAPQPTTGSNLWSTQGLLFAGGYLYYQDDTLIRRISYHAGNTSPSQDVTTLADVSTVVKQATEHWPKVMDVAQDGTVYVTNAGSQSEVCSSTDSLTGAVFTLNSDNSLSLVARGFRNPIAIRCEATHDVCLVAELALDFSAGTGGREKIVPVRQGDNWGYPCCATQNEPYGNETYSDTGGTPDCSQVTPEGVSLEIGNTPFGLDYEPGLWPAPWTSRAFITLHGAAGTWVGARIMALSLDPNTGLPVAASDLDGSPDSPNNLLDFATGWDDGQQDHGRPAPLAFAADGRLFVGDDQKGLIFWIAPVGLASP